SIRAPRPPPVAAWGKTVTMLFAIALAFSIGAPATPAASLAGGRVAAPRRGTALVAGALAGRAGGPVVCTTTYADLARGGLAPSLSTLAFLIAVCLFITTCARESRPLGLVLVPLTTVLLGIALTLGVARAGEPLAFRGIWFSFHVLLAFIGYAGLAVAVAAGLLYLLQFRALKDQRPVRVAAFVRSLPAP